MLSWALTAFLVGWLVLVPRFDQHDRTTISGELESVDVVALSESSQEVELVVAGERVRFRIASGVFKDALGTQLPPSLKPGAAVSAIVPVDDYRNPVQGASHGGPTVYVDALAADAQDVLTLAQSRGWDERNRHVALVLFAAFLLGAVFLTLVAILRYRIWREDVSTTRDGRAP